MAIMAVYRWRLDALAAVTVYPPWVWLLPGVVLWLAAWRLKRRYPLVGAAAWLLFLATTVDSPTQLMRGITRFDPENNPPSQWLERRCRTITLNCGGIGLDADELSPLRPDLVLLQEPPGREQLARLTADLFGGQGEFTSSSDTAILARGTVTPLDLNVPHGHFFTAAEVTLWNSCTLIAVSLRLEPYPVRFDFWRGDYWRAYTTVRKKQRGQTIALMTAVSIAAGDRPLIVAGDFNAPPGDPIFLPLALRLRDAYPRVSLGYGGTMTNDYPLLRIDCIWASPDLTPQTAWVRASRRSDHRRLACDLLLYPPE